MTKYMVIVGEQFVLHCKNEYQKHESYRLTPYNFEDVGHTRYFNLETAELLAKLFKGRVASVAIVTPKLIQPSSNEYFKRRRKNLSNENNGPDMIDSLMPSVHESILTMIPKQIHSSLLTAPKSIGKDIL